MSDDIFGRINGEMRKITLQPIDEDGPCGPAVTRELLRYDHRLGWLCVDEDDEQRWFLRGSVVEVEDKLTAAEPTMAAALRGKVVLDTIVIVHPDDPGENNRQRLYSNIERKLMTRAVVLRRGLYRVILEKVTDPQASQFPDHVGMKGETRDE